MDSSSPFTALCNRIAVVLLRQAHDVLALCRGVCSMVSDGSAVVQNECTEFLLSKC